jgi:hypothetical protein
VLDLAICRIVSCAVGILTTYCIFVNRDPFFKSLSLSLLVFAHGFLLSYCLTRARAHCGVPH